MTESADYLAAILRRKRREVERRHRHGHEYGTERVERASLAHERLRRRPGHPPAVIAEVKLRSPSAGEIRARRPGIVQALAEDYLKAGASAVSVLCDRAGFGGSVLDLRRAGRAVEGPLLFKEFVLDPLQVQLARAAGAHMVLLLVRALEPARLQALTTAVLEAGMAPVVEAADEAELELALATPATIIGVNARDLRTFRVDEERALRTVARIPQDRIAVHMSGLGTAQDFVRVASSRADAVLVGEALLRAEQPGVELGRWLAAARAAGV